MLPITCIEETTYVSNVLLMTLAPLLITFIAWAVQELTKYYQERVLSTSTIKTLTETETETKNETKNEAKPATNIKADIVKVVSPKRC